MNNLLLTMCMLLSAAFLSGCGQSGDLYLPPPHHPHTQHAD